MKNNKKIKKLQFTKETIARLGESNLSALRGGQQTESDIRTRPGDTCTCFTRTSEVNCA